MVHFAKKVSLATLKKHDKKGHYVPVGKDNGVAEYVNKEETRVEGPWSAGISPARLNVKGEKARKNMELVSMGAEEALRTGEIGLL